MGHDPDQGQRGDRQGGDPGRLPLVLRLPDHARERDRRGRGRYFPLAGGTFLQAESEVAAINMVYGAAAAGERTMTASSGPGLS